MEKSFIGNIIKNKRNGQININPKKSELSKDFLKELDNLGKRKIKIKEWEFI